MTFQYYQAPTKRFGNESYEFVQQEHHILLQRRKELNLTQQQVADQAGIQLRQYQRFECGERSISGSSGRIMLAICKVLLLDPYLFIGEGNEEPEIKHVIIPPVTTQGLEFAIPSLAYYNLVSAIPRGMVCTDDDIMQCLRSAYGRGALEIKNDMFNVNLYYDYCFPFWRVVSAKGYLINCLYYSKDLHKKLLEEDGVKISQVGKNESFRVDDFIHRRFDINNFKITVMKTEEQILQQLQEASAVLKKDKG